MPSSPSPRKPIDALRARDVELYPVWEFIDESNALEDEDETWVRPVETNNIPAGRYALSVAATITGREGRPLVGIVSVTTEGIVETGHVAILLDDEYLFVPTPDLRGALDQYHRIEQRLGLEGKLFPLRFVLRVPLAGETALLTGEIGL